MENKKILFIPNWNGHLYLQEKDDVSVINMYKQIKYDDKILVDVVKNNIEKTNENIKKTFKKYLNNGNNFIVSITGDHSNTYPLFLSYKEASKSKKIALVIFDAHPDVEVSAGQISHEDYLRAIVDDNIINPDDIYLFGIRTFSRKEYEYILDKNINHYPITDILKNVLNIKNVLEDIVKKYDEIYLSIDIDVLDPDDAPGTYYTEWCGLYIEELLEFISILKSKISCVDITEYFKDKDDDKHITQNNVYKLIETLLENK